MADEPSVALVVTVCPCPKAHPLTDPTAGGTLCGAQTKQEEAKYPTCHRPAGWGTDNAGVSGAKCKLHGGAAHNLTHGRYSRIERPRIRQLIEDLSQDDDPLNILPELVLARALLIDFIERYDEMSDALLAWHESYQLKRRPLPEPMLVAFERVIDEWEIALTEKAGEATDGQQADAANARKFVNFLRGEDEGGKPRKVLDITDAINHADTITRMVERMEKIRAENAISRKDLMRVMDAMGRAVLRNVTDEKTLKAIRSDWLSIHV